MTDGRRDGGAAAKDYELRNANITVRDITILY